jgi:hypothetical protein
LPFQFVVMLASARAERTLRTLRRTHLAFPGEQEGGALRQRLGGKPMRRRWHTPVARGARRLGLIPHSAKADFVRDLIACKGGMW